MRTINDNGNFNEFFTLQDGEQFVYKPNDKMEFFAIKVGNNAILINYSNKFIIAKGYKNTLSIGGGIVRQFNDFESALQNIEIEIANL